MTILLTYLYIHVLVTIIVLHQLRMIPNRFIHVTLILDLNQHMLLYLRQNMLHSLIFEKYVFRKCIQIYFHTK